MACAFCTDEDLQKRIIVKDSLVMAFPSFIPITPGHTLVTPVRCVAKIDELTDEEFAAIRQLLLKIKNSLQKVVGAEGFNFAWNDGKVAGQAVNHLHIHVVPRKPGDNGITRYEPRKFLYWPGKRKQTSEKTLQEMAELIRSGI